MRILDSLRQRARELKSEVIALYLAARHPRTPWYAKLLVAAIATYALSPIDLIPDFIPVLGLLDDIVLLPLGIAWALKMIPADVMSECREKALAISARPTSFAAAVAIIATWLVFLILAVWGLSFALSD